MTSTKLIRLQLTVTSCSSVQYDKPLLCQDSYDYYYKEPEKYNNTKT